MEAKSFNTIQVTTSFAHKQQDYSNGSLIRLESKLERLSMEQVVGKEVQILQAKMQDQIMHFTNESKLKQMFSDLQEKFEKQIDGFSPIPIKNISTVSTKPTR